MPSTERAFTIYRKGSWTARRIGLQGARGERLGSLPDSPHPRQSARTARQRDYEPLAELDRGTKGPNEQPGRPSVAAAGLDLGPLPRLRPLRRAGGQGREGPPRFLTAGRPRVAQGGLRGPQHVRASLPAVRARRPSWRGGASLSLPRARDSAGRGQAPGARPGEWTEPETLRGGGARPPAPGQGRAGRCGRRAGRPPSPGTRLRGEGPSRPQLLVGLRENCLFCTRGLGVEGVEGVERVEGVGGEAQKPVRARYTPFPVRLRLSNLPS